jgi:8-oxo-dGTP diphosphatase
MNKTIHVVGAALQNERSEILCALRSPTMSLPNMWEFPGGKMELGETAEETLVREIREELGCEIKVDELLEDIFHEYSFATIHLITYKARIISGTPQAKEHARIEWVPLEKLPSLEWAPADVPTVHRLVNHYLTEQLK